MILCPAGEGRGLYLVFDWAEFELSEILKTHRDKKEVVPRSVDANLHTDVNNYYFIGKRGFLCGSCPDNFPGFQSVGTLQPDSYVARVCAAV